MYFSKPRNFWMKSNKKLLKFQPDFYIMFLVIELCVNLQKYTFANLRLILFIPHFQIFRLRRRRFQRAYDRRLPLVSA